MSRQYHEEWERQDMLGIDPEEPKAATSIPQAGYAAWVAALKKREATPEHQAKVRRREATIERIAAKMRADERARRNDPRNSAS